MIDALALPWFGPTDAPLPLVAARTGSTNGTLLVWLAIGGGLVAVLGGLGYFLRQKLHQHRHHSHPALFHGLCSAHHLDRNSRKLLMQVVRYHRLSQPARLFTEPQWLDPAGLSGTLLTRAEELLALRSQLFSLSVSAPASPR